MTTVPVRRIGHGFGQHRVTPEAMARRGEGGVMKIDGLAECITAGCAQHAGPSSLCIACSYAARNRPDTELGARARAALDARPAPIDWRARALAAEARIERLAASKYVKALRRYLKVEPAKGWMGALSKRVGQDDVVVTFGDLRGIVAGVDIRLKPSSIRATPHE